MNITWTGIGVILAIIFHVIALVRGWTIIEMRLKAVAEAFKDLNASLALRDARMDAAWKKIDNLGERMIKMETIHTKIKGEN